jgi:hypothetical protein
VNDLIFEETMGYAAAVFWHHLVAVDPATGRRWRRLLGADRTAELIAEGKAIGAETAVAEHLSEP